MMLNMKIGAVMICVILFSFNMDVRAAECNYSFELVDFAQTENAGRSTTEESWGWGNLYGTNPLFSKPEAYAVTTVKEGSAYKVSAQISVTNSDGTVESLTEVVNENAASATSGTIVAKTSSCKFAGVHRIQNLKGGGWQRAETSKSY